MTSIFFLRGFLLPSSGGGIKSLTPFALQDRRLTLPHIAAGSKTFFGNVNKLLIGKTDYVRTSENPATPAFDTR
ncbi:hypothetical protein EWR95_19250 [Escherichia coli]|nr:hypothetical protein [Escherichia coli]